MLRVGEGLAPSRGTNDPTRPGRGQAPPLRSRFTIHDSRFRRAQRPDTTGHRTLATSHSPGFTLLELIVVMAVIGILATLALPKLQNVPRRARESTLKNNLHTIRSVLDQHKADKGTYPESLEALEEQGYLRSVPVDPITKSRETWELIYEQRDSEDPPAEVDDEEPPGIIDVKSGAEGRTMDGVPYGEL